MQHILCKDIANRVENKMNLHNFMPMNYQREKVRKALQHKKQTSLFCSALGFRYIYYVRKSKNILLFAHLIEICIIFATKSHYYGRKGNNEQANAGNYL